MINEEEYAKLCDACDKILLNEDTSYNRVSIPWLHVIRAHSVFLNKYEEIFESNILIFIYNFFFKNKLNFFGGFIIIFLRSVFSRLKKSKTNFPTNPDIIFISHLINRNDLKSNSDFYFGDIPNLIEREGYKCLTLLINQTTDNSNELNCHLNIANKLVLDNVLSFKKEFSFFRLLCKESLKLFYLAFKQSSLLIKKIYFTASKYTVNTNSQNVLRINYQIRNLIKTHNPKIVILTFEGHSWEKCVIHDIKKHNKNIKVFAYQHSALFHSQHSINLKISPLYVPDLILTSGMISKKQFISFQGLKGIPTKVLGSTRGIKYSDNHLSVNNGNCCLVLPEGIINECYILFKFSLNYALLNPCTIFIWRLHPLINFDDLDFCKIDSLPPNIILSYDSLNNDILKCKWALYRGSTSILTAIQGGLIPLYLHIQNEIIIDPLYEVNHLIDKILTINDFSECIQREINKSFQVKLKQYSDDFYVPLNHKVILNELINHECF